MDRHELIWRGRVASQKVVDRTRAAIQPQRWDRRSLLKRVAGDARYGAIRESLRGERWRDAHTALVREIADASPRFAIAPGLRRETVVSIRRSFPASAADADRRARRLLGGVYDLLGYAGLRFDAGDLIDWHLDPVHRRRAPLQFWSTVPFLDPSCGDHKIIWELNRHQHWLTLGRAFWLTGDPAYKRRVICELESWMAANPPLVGINWASMLELSLRGLSWIWALHFFADPADDLEEPWTVDLLLGLDRQLDHVERHLSYYFSPNTHLLGEALALYVGGLALPMLTASSRRSEVGRRVLCSEIGRQIQGDGGHCERSTHYHRYALDFYILALIVARITGDEAVPELTGAVARLAAAARLLADDRGCLPHIGDDDGGAAFRLAGRSLDDLGDTLETASALLERPDLRVGPPTEEARWLLAHPIFASIVATGPPSSQRSPTSAALVDTGYYVSRVPMGHHLVFDAGPHGYANGGHAHADGLALTLSVRSVPLLIDPGTYCYTSNIALRDHFRSTMMHNTLSLDERPASMPGGPFGWAREADGRVNRWCTTAGFDYIDATHDGYAPVEHRRHVAVLPDDLVVVADLVNGAERHSADVHWHLGPRWTIETCTKRRAIVRAKDQWAEIIAVQGEVECFSADAVIGLGWHAPVYGRLAPNTTIRIRRAARGPYWIVTLLGLRADNAIECVDSLPVSAVLTDGIAHSIAVRITRASTVELIVIAIPSSGTSPSAYRTDDLETDAAMALRRCTRAGDVFGLGMVDGSRALLAGTPVLSLLSRASATYVYGDALATGNTRASSVRDRWIC
jgi:uncharacterized heparinase superfamily protein